MLALVVVRSDEPLANGAEAAVPHVLGPRVVEIGQPPSRRQEPRRLPVEPGQPGAIQVVERPRADQRVDAGRQSGRLQVAHVAEPEVDPVAEPLQSPAGLLQHGLGGVQPHARAVRQLFQERLQVRPRAAADVDHQPGLRPVVGDQRGGDRAGERQQVGEPVGGGPPPRELGVLPDLRAVLLRGGHEAPPPAVDSMGVGALLNRRVVSAGRVMSSPVTSIAGVRAMADSRPATASGETNRAAARKVPAAAIASPRSSGWTTSLARAGPRVCRAPAPSPLAASSTATRGAEPASRATSPEPMPATSMLAVTARTSVRPRTRATSAAPAMLAPLATDTSTPMTGTGWAARSSATGTCASYCGSVQALLGLGFDVGWELVGGGDSLQAGGLHVGGEEDPDAATGGSSAGEMATLGPVVDDVGFDAEAGGDVGDAVLVVGAWGGVDVGVLVGRAGGALPAGRLDLGWERDAPAAGRAAAGG